MFHEFIATFARTWGAASSWSHVLVYVATTARYTTPRDIAGRKYAGNKEPPATQFRQIQLSFPQFREGQQKMLASLDDGAESGRILLRLLYG